jgi:hypothetical protein
MWDGFAQFNGGEVNQTWGRSKPLKLLCQEEALFSAGAAERDGFLSEPVLLAVFGPEPLRDLLRIESYRPTHAKTRNLSARGHTVNVLIVHSQYGRKVRNLNATTPGFQLFNQIEFHAIPPGNLFNSTVPDDPAMHSVRKRGNATVYQRGSRESHRVEPTSVGFCD